MVHQPLGHHRNQGQTGQETKVTDHGPLVGLPDKIAKIFVHFIPEVRHHEERDQEDPNLLNKIAILEHLSDTLSNKTIRQTPISAKRSLSNFFPNFIKIPPMSEASDTAPVLHPLASQMSD